MVPNTFDFTIYKHLLGSLFTPGVGFREFISDYSDLFPEREFSILHTSTPNIKMYYPEPFIASPTFINDDIWFLHITIYQYWLWFIFISLIVFFFLGFLITLRWCNIRHRPARETRGVSRSKCGDLITATVPVSWAASIIIHESTDAIEFADGFGSTDVAIGIRAYQWGWEYYYPKGLNLTNTLNDSTFIGHSLTNSLGSGEDTTVGFKSAATTSDFLNGTGSAYSTNLLSLTTNPLAGDLMDFDFGNNRLVARHATTLLDSNAQLDLDSILDLSDTSDNGFTFFYHSFIDYVWEHTYPAKPLYINHQLSFFSGKSAFLNAMSFLNWHDWLLLAASRTLTPDTQTSLSLLRTGLNTLPNTLKSLLINPPTALVCKFNFATQANWVITNSPLWATSFIADQDFKRWSSLDLLEDLFWVPSDLTVDGFFGVSDFSPNLKTICPLHYSLVSPIFDFSQTEYLSAITVTQYVPLFTMSSVTALDVFRLLTGSWLDLTVREWPFSVWKTNQLSLLKAPLTATFVLSLERAVSPLTDVLLNFNDLTGPTTLKLKSTTLTNLGDNTDILVLWRNFVTYQTAFWKVFKPLLDEQRGTFFTQNFSNTAPTLPIISTVTPLLNQVQKNTTESFVSLLSLRTTSSLRSLLNTQKTYNLIPVFCFPFNLAFESDSIRYAWFDWYSVRNSVITKALDTSVFNLHASKDYSFTFSSGVANLASINRYENYFLKYSLARKFYLPIHTYKPFFYNLLQLTTCLGVKNTSEFFFFTNYTKFLDFLYSPNRFNSSLFFTGAFTYLRPYAESLNSLSNPINPLMLFFDTMARREYLLCSLCLQANINSPGRLYSDIEALNNKPSQAGRGLSLLNPYVTLYSKYTHSSLDNAPTISQYRPLRKGIVNMIRIQADKAIAMPTDTRLQILAVSKDIIHSWAIPAAGIKIDCIPGYSSHRVAIFTLSGIYWGQCMEICGRFHHWMPIVVYFLRRDLFCLWCIHFIFKNNQTNSTLQSLSHTSIDSNILFDKGYNVWKYTL